MPSEIPVGLAPPGTVRTVVTVGSAPVGGAGGASVDETGEEMAEEVVIGVELATWVDELGVEEVVEEADEEGVEEEDEDKRDEEEVGFVLVELDLLFVLLFVVVVVVGAANANPARKKKYTALI